MPPSGGSQTVTQNTAPWKGQQPYLTGGYIDPKTGEAKIGKPKDPNADLITGVLPQASNLYDSGKLSPDYYPNSTIADQSAATQQALDLTQQRALNGSPLVSSGKDYTSSLLNGGFLDSNPGNSMYAATYGQANPAMSGYAQTAAMSGYNPSNMLWRGAMNSATNNPASGMLNTTASGAYLNANPYLDATFNKAADAVQSRVNNSFASAGRFGSGLNQRTLGDSLGDLATNIYGGNYANERNLQESATSRLGDVYNQGQGLAQNAISNIGNNYNQGQQNKLAALGGMSDAYNSQARINQDAAAGISGNYNNERGLQQQGVGLATGLAANDYADLQALSGVGAAQDQRAQDFLNADINRYNYNQNKDLNALNTYQGLVSGNYGNSTSTNTPMSSNTGAGILGGALGGAQLGGMLGGGFTALPWLGAGANLAGFLGSGSGIGSMIGAGLGLLSDARTKENITHIGFENGYPIYAFSYKGDPAVYRGVMAQDVMNINPDAIIDNGDVMTVDYDKIGVELRRIH